MKNKTSLSYRDAGVDIDTGNALIDQIRDDVKRTKRPGVLGGIGGFGGVFELPTGYKKPVLVSGTDGVGTKLNIAQQLSIHDTIGIDLVAMCANDVLVLGAKPLYFLDYYATGKLSVDVATEVIRGITKGCIEAEMALIGGETAEMPGMYQQGDYDLAGFCVGIAEKAELIDGSKVKAGDVMIGLASSGPHANGYSLIRKILATTNTRLDQTFGTQTFGETLIQPTRIYVQPVLALLQKHPIHAISHITGGGFIDNLPRVMPNYTCAQIDHQSWESQPIFEWLQHAGNIDKDDMYRTFNCGIGMVLIVAKEEAEMIAAEASSLGERAFIIGRITTCKQPTPYVEIT